MPAAAGLFRLALVPLVLLFACAAWRDAAVEHWLDRDPAEVPALLRGDSRIALAASDAAVLDGDGEGDRFWREVAGNARAALRAGPLQPAALRLLGAAAADGGEEGASLSYLLLSQRLSRRDVPTQIALLRSVAEAGDYRRTFMHLDRILTTEPSAGGQFFAPMAQLLADPHARAEMARYGRRPWFPAFAWGAVNETDDPADLAALLTQSGAAPAQLPPSLLPQLLGRLLDAGDYGEARRLATRFGGASATAIDRLALDTDSADQRFAPLTWRLGASEAVQAGIAPGGALEVELRPNVAAPLLERVTALPHGAYAVEQSVEREADGAELLLSWELRCGRNSGPPTVDHTETVRGESESSLVRIDVPPGCPLQFWRLAAVADGAQSDADFRLSFRLHPRAGTSLP